MGEAAKSKNTKCNPKVKMLKNSYRIQNTMSKVPGFQPARINNQIKLDSPKVVDTVEIEDLGDKAVFCRCWKSKKFPYCDGSHAKHNELTGDNVAPLIVKKSS